MIYQEIYIPYCNQNWIGIAHKTTFLSDEMYNWLKKNVKGKFKWNSYIHYLDQEKPSYVIFQFQYKIDAARFRLKWQ